jgi:hypothetical protein
MQEAMFACLDINTPGYIASEDLGLLNFTSTPRRKPTFSISEMANAVIGEGGELLECRHLITNPKTRATWLHSYGNEIGRLAQGMPGRNTGTNTIVFIHKNQVPRDRAKDASNPTWSASQIHSIYI